MYLRLRLKIQDRILVQFRRLQRLLMSDQNGSKKQQRQKYDLQFF